MSQIIGCTTTSAASMHELIARAKPSVIIVEEAGEILEAHILTALCRSVKKVIMIGDHKQLRPKLESYELQKDSCRGFDLDVSLFERMATSNRFPLLSLNIQHRMRPEISEIVRRCTYPELQDHERVRYRDNIRGLQKNLAFITHNIYESSEDESVGMDSKSRTNQYEAEMTVLFVKYLALQGYSLSDIVVLTPYLGQLVLITELLTAQSWNGKSNFCVEIGEQDTNDLVKTESVTIPTLQQLPGEKIRVATIDNFQGEEAKIIVASLVRSNKSNDIGFLSSPERVNVLFSRARDGMFVLGNAGTFRSCKHGKTVWKGLLDYVHSQGCLVNGFPVYCSRHNEKPTIPVNTTESLGEWARCGGCSRPCEFLLPKCNHPCPLGSCHPLELHDNVPCSFKEHVKCSAGLHDVDKMCGESPKPCMQRRLVTVPGCSKGHKSSRRCFEASAVHQCQTCEKAKAELKKARDVSASEEKQLNESIMLEQLELEKSRAQLQKAVSIKKSRELLDALKQESGMMQKEQQHLNEISQEEDRSEQHPLSPSSSSTVALDTSWMNSVPSSSYAACPIIRSCVETDASVKARASCESTTAAAVPKPSGDNCTEAEFNQKLVPVMDSMAGGKWTQVFSLCSAGKSASTVQAVRVAFSLAALTAEFFLDSDPEDLVAQLRRLKPPQWFIGALLFAIANALVYQSSRPMFSHQAAKKAVAMIMESSFSQLKTGILWGQLKVLADTIPCEVAQSNASTSGRSNQDAKEIENQIAKVQKRSRDSFTSLRELSGLTGLKLVKESFLKLFHLVDISMEQGISSISSYNIRFEGNPGTGKTTVAKIYAKFLQEVRILPESAITKIVTGAELLGKGVKGVESILDEIKTAKGGVVFLDEAYQLNPKIDGAGRQVLDFILAHSERFEDPDYGKVVWIFAGYQKDMEKLFEHNPGLPSRFPYRFVFEDYSDAELLEIFNGYLQSGGADQKSSSTSSTSGGRQKRQPFVVVDPKWSRIAMRRIGGKRNTSGFGNARAVRTFFDQCRQRQAARITKCRGLGEAPQLYEFMREDLLGPFADENALRNSRAWQKLQAMEGLAEVKDAIRKLIDVVFDNAQREEKEEPCLEFSLNKVFLGNPGTGKTTVGKIYGEILSDLGLLSKGEVLLKAPSDFLGDVVGGSEAKTRALLAQAEGCVLIIDEAYSLLPPGSVDPYRTAVIDTIVEQVRRYGSVFDCVLTAISLDDRSREDLAMTELCCCLVTRMRWKR
jgi:DNA replication protein DnaC